MKFQNQNAVIYQPEGKDALKALSETTDLCIGAHQDDIEIEAFGVISACLKSGGKRRFSGVTVTDGAGSPRAGEYADCSDEDMKKIRIKEQNAAAKIGGYAAMIQLGYSSSAVKKGGEDIVKEIAGIIEAASPETLYTHNLADKHDTHVAVALRVLEAVMTLPKEKRPKRVVCLEGWRDLDWLGDSEKAVFDSSDEKLALKILGVYKSQIAGGKRYDLASVGRRRANATFFASHDVDEAESLCFGFDVTDELYGGKSPEEIIRGAIERFEKDVISRVSRFS